MGQAVEESEKRPGAARVGGERGMERRCVAPVSDLSISRKRWGSVAAQLVSISTHHARVVNQITSAEGTADAALC
jgi:hypothetical protein